MPLLMAPCSAASIVCLIASRLAYDTQSIATPTRGAPQEGELKQARRSWALTTARAVCV